ncbi:hypothetical protein DFJ77DRAFT_162875 [Powellomyces hirtus]|nr:hypothetical protein DFJ77DRAFT_162875 [Powellomyces hirtus]
MHVLTLALIGSALLASNVSAAAVNPVPTEFGLRIYMGTGFTDLLGDVFAEGSNVCTSLFDAEKDAKSLKALPGTVCFVSSICDAAAASCDICVDEGGRKTIPKDVAISGFRCVAVKGKKPCKAYKQCKYPRQ